MASQVTQPKLRFGPFEIDLQTGELQRAGHKLRLQEKPLRLLEILISRAGELVSRAEIQQRLWSADTTVDFEDGLNTVVKKLREALNDSAEQPKFIETIPKRGYRFIAEVEVLAPAQGNGLHGGAAWDGIDRRTRVTLPPVSDALVTDAGAGEETFVAAKGRRVGLRGIGVLSLLVVLVVALVVAGRFAMERYTASRLHPVIAVLPMVNLTGDSSLGYVCDGITEEIITHLASMDGARIGVIARTSAMSYRGASKTVKQIGEELNAQYVIEGSLQGQRDHVRLIVQLVRVSDQTHLWAESYEGDRALIYQTLPEISSRVVSLITASKKEFVVRETAPASFEAHDLYLRGLYFLSQRSREGFEGALLNFGQAVELDPHYARAYAELSITYSLMGQYNWMRQAEADAQGRAAALQALALDPSLAEAHAALGFSDWFYKWDEVSAERELRRAIELEPNNVNAFHWLAMVMMSQGDAKGAAGQMRAAIALDPNAMILRTNLGWAHYVGRDYPLAVREMEEVAKQSPGFLSAHVKLWWTYSVMNREKDAWRELESILKVITSPVVYQELQRAYNGEGYKAALKRWAQENEKDGSSYSNAPDRARLLMFAGDYPGAIRELQKGVADHDGWMILVETDPAFDALHSDPSYRDVVLRVRRSTQIASPAGP
jgi:TolB-like protein/DNA-binding winged helix-turn-helix (wHTH) protein/Flp pilus assembly protein TadD